MKERTHISSRAARDQGLKLLGNFDRTQIKGLPMDPNRAAQLIGGASAQILDGHFNTEARERAAVINGVLRAEFRELSFGNAVRLAELASHAAVNPWVLAESSFVVGYGASPDPNISPRVAAYPISAIRTAERMQAMGLPPPNIEIVFAQETAITVNNHSDPKVTRANVAQMKDFILAYIATFHPSVQARVKVVFDTPWNKHTPMTTAQIEMAKWLLSQFTDDREVTAAIRHIQGMGNRHHGDSRKYAGIHPFILGDRLCLPPTNFRASRPPTGYRISMGGEPERDFGIVREAIRGSASSEEMGRFLNRFGNRLPLSEEQRREIQRDLEKFTTEPTNHDIVGLIDAGQRPVYYYVGGADTAIDAFARGGWQPISNGHHGSKVGITLQALERDYALLETDTGGRLQKFCAEYVGDKSKSKSPRREQTDPLVKAGYSKDVVHWADQMIGSIKQTDLQVFSQAINDSISSRKVGEVQSHEFRRPLTEKGVGGLSNRETLRRAFADAIVAAFSDLDLTNPPRRVHEVMTLAPKIFDAVIATPGINAIHFSDLKQLVKFALGVAVNPDCLGDTVINIGLGGDPHPPSARIYPYLHVPLDVYRRLNSLFDSFAREKFPQEIEQARIIKEAAQRARAQGEDFDHLERRVRIIWINQANNVPQGQLPELTEREWQAVKDKCGVTHKRPQLRVFLATNAAIAINHDGDPEVAERLHNVAQVTIRTLTTFIQQYYPDVLQSIEFIQDRPLQELSPVDRVLIEYYGSIVQKHATGSLAESLRGFAETHASGDTKKGLLYSALHPSFYQHSIPGMPTPHIYGPEVRQYHHVLSFGGPTEERFYAIMEVIGQHATPQGFIDFIDRAYPHLRGEARKVMRNYDGRDKRTSVRMTTKNGTIPPYYQATIAVGPFSGSIDLLIPEKGLPTAGEIQNHIGHLGQVQSEQLSPVHRSIKEAVIFDLKQLMQSLQP